MKKRLCSGRLVELYKESTSCADYLKKYGKYTDALLSKLDYAAIADCADCLSRARNRGSTIFFIGNGGSAATASHFAQDLGDISRKCGTKAFRAISLSDNAPSLTALGNDYGFDRIYVDQLSNLFKKGDVLLAISASGNSPNVVKATQLAKRMRGTAIGLVGFDGGRLAGLCDHVIHIRTGKGEYGPVEDIHLVLEHMITTYIMMKDISVARPGKR